MQFGFFYSLRASIQRQMDNNYHVETNEPIYQISCYSCGIIAGQDTDEEDLKATAKARGFFALHSENDGTYNLCRYCVESDPDLFTPKPIDMILYCPKCDLQHIDEAKPESCESCGHLEVEHVCDDIPFGRNCNFYDCDCPEFVAWLNPPHKKHRCVECHHVWKPALIPTNGVTALPEVSA
jgi:hypothetical protein